MPKYIAQTCDETLRVTFFLTDLIRLEAVKHDCAGAAAAPRMLFLLMQWTNGCLRFIKLMRRLSKWPSIVRKMASNSIWNKFRMWPEQPHEIQILRTNACRSVIAGAETNVSTCSTSSVRICSVNCGGENFSLPIESRTNQLYIIPYISETPPRLL